MTNCPVESCKEIKELKDNINFDRDNRRGWLKYWAGGIGSFLVIIGAALTITWANAKEVPEVKSKVEEHDKTIVEIRTKQQAILENSRETKEDVKEMRKSFDELRHLILSRNEGKKEE